MGEGEGKTVAPLPRTSFFWLSLLPAGFPYPAAAVVERPEALRLRKHSRQ